MTHKQALEELEYTIVARMDLFSDECENFIDEQLRLNKLDVLTRTLQKINQLTKEIENTPPAPIYLIKN